MSLLVRINLALGLAVVLALSGLGILSSYLLAGNARRDLAREAALMLDSAAATRSYTSAEILPLLTESLKHEFLPQSVPFYAATQDFLRLREQHPQFSYKEATLNPTNPRDRAMDWEADLIQQFRNDSHSRELRGERATPMGAVFYLARPIQASRECLECHGEAHAAPQTMLTRYGADNGFGWQPNEVVGAQVVSVPLAGGAFDDAHRTLWQLIIAVAAVLLLLWLLINVLLWRTVTRPLRHIAALADSVSLGASGVQFPEERSTELSGLVRAFDRLRISLEKAMKLLRQ